MEAPHGEVGIEAPAAPPVAVEAEQGLEHVPSTRPLSCRWTLWAHLPHDTDWSVGSYKNIMTLSTVEEAACLYAAVPPDMVKNCMLFLMRDGIKPTWEDDKNRSGGCFSHKIANKGVDKAWKNVSYLLMGGGLSSSAKTLQRVNGITISPKKNFCILKIWMAGCGIQDPSVFADIPGVPKQGCIFKRHAPQF